VAGSPCSRGHSRSLAAATARSSDPVLCRHRGHAVVFDGVDDLHARIDDPMPDADCVLVLRGTGPVAVDLACPR
jgi:dihydroxyacid dehydratase/phosphogluconate dehydratase